MLSAVKYITKKLRQEKRPWQSGPKTATGTSLRNKHQLVPPTQPTCLPRALIRDILPVNIKQPLRSLPKKPRIQVGCSDTGFTREFELSQTFQHYIEESEVRYVKTSNGVKLFEGFHIIPYTYTEASITPEQWWIMTALADGIRPLEIGYKVNDIKYILDERITPSVAHTSCKYTGEPEIYFYSDEDLEVAYNTDMDRFNKEKLPNRDFTQRVLNSREEGKLSEMHINWSCEGDFGTAHEDLSLMHPMDFDALTSAKGYSVSLMNKPYMFKIPIDDSLGHTWRPTTPFKWWPLNSPLTDPLKVDDRIMITRIPNRKLVVGDSIEAPNLKDNNMENECVDFLTHLVRFHGITPCHMIKLGNIYDRDEAIEASIEI
jgi:hypothetical protein